MGSPMKVSIRVKTFEDKRALVCVTFENLSDNDVWVLRDSPPLFVKLNGQEIEEIGPSEKRRPYTINDYDKLKPHSSETKYVDISDQFAFAPGKHEYTIKTGGGYRDPVTGRSWDGPAAIATFVLER